MGPRLWAWILPELNTHRGVAVSTSRRKTKFDYTQHIPYVNITHEALSAGCVAAVVF